MDDKKVTWAAIQVLSGGMMFGAMDAFGTMPEYVLSYSGLSSVKFDPKWCDADGVPVCDKEEDYEKAIVTCANEYNTFHYLEKIKKLPPYFNITNRGMFDDLSDDDSDLNVDIKPDPLFGTAKEIKDLHVDVVVAVPVCSGLSNATTTGNQDTRDDRNNNMKWITKFTLSKIMPKAYVFENAPGLFGKKGESVRKIIEEMAKKYGYSITYYKTDTKLHDNAQYRPRTFCILWRWPGFACNPPILNYENKKVNVIDFLKRIPENAPQQRAPEMSIHTKMLVEFFKTMKDWRKLLASTGETGLHYVVANGLTDKYVEFINGSNIDEKKKEQVLRGVQHAVDKFNSGSWIFDTSLKLPKETHTPTIFHKNTQCLLHPTEDRLLTIREMLFLMGMPNDFWFFGSNSDIIHKIGQNVPVRTAQWICSEVKRIVDNWDTLRMKSRQTGFIKVYDNTEFFDNTKGEKDVSDDS